IIGLSHLGLRARDVEHARDYLGKIQSSAQSLLQILNDILDVSKIEAGKLSLESIGFDLYEVLDNLSGMLSVRAAEKNLELLFDVDPNVPAALVGDPLRLGQILLNLTGNAIKFTDEGQIVVRVGLSKQGRDFARLKFEIRDTGIGMTPDQVASLFQAFAQADTSTTRRYGGTGLGLTIVKRLVEMMDGDISVESASGEGSTFRFDVRLGLGAGSGARRRVVPDKLRDLRVLVADDNPTAVEILRGTLESFGFRVAVARDGAEAVARVRGARNDPFGLVIMDWQMPRMNGIEASRKIREFGPPQPPMIVMVTAFGREEVERQAQDAKLDGFLVKPVNPSLLFDSILEAFGEGTVTRREEPPAAQIDGERLRGLRVLVAEDNEINQQVARELLEAVGVEVTIAENGVQAIQRLNTQVFDVVLMDLQMPEMDGIEATKRIRAESGPLARIPVIAMTANAMAEDRDHCLEAGMDDHIGKPVDVVQLYDVLARHAGAVAVGVSGAPAAPAADAAASPRSRDEADEPPFNFPLAIQRLGGSRPIFEKLAGRFVKSPENAAMIETMLQSGDTAGARRVIHTLKGVAASLGAMRLAKAAADAEKAAASGTFDRRELEMLGDLEREAREVLGQVAASA
ncbi:MAG TPA: response regulator, partial [Nevskiaceae bacterium]|nr:response regulator [Nevskiaceae bacterium]